MFKFGEMLLADYAVSGLDNSPLSKTFVFMMLFWARKPWIARALTPERQTIRIGCFILESFFRLFGISCIGMFMDSFMWDCLNSLGVLTSNKK